MKRITEDECLKIMKESGMFPNIIDHSRQVRNVAVRIADSLKDGIKTDRALVASGALLHDIAKTKSIQDGTRGHDREGAGILMKMGLEDEAEICRAHVKMPDFKADGPLLEKEIVHYADKRVKHDKVVSIKERMDDLIVRYGSTDERIRSIEEDRKFVTELEKKIQGFMKTDIDTALAGL